MWRVVTWRRRAGQAFELGGPDVADGTTARFIRRGLSRAATGWPGCQTEPRRAGILAVLGLSSGDAILNFSELGMVSLRQESFGKEEETRTLKPFVETLRVRIPPGKAGPAARSESCVAVGQPTLRSVDSQVKGRVIEPRKYEPRGAFVVDTGGGRVRQLTLGPLSLPDPAGVEEHGQ